METVLKNFPDTRLSDHWFEANAIGDWLKLVCVGSVGHYASLRESLSSVLRAHTTQLLVTIPMTSAQSALRVLANTHRLPMRAHSTLPSQASSACLPKPYRAPQRKPIRALLSVSTRALGFCTASVLCVTTRLFAEATHCIAWSYQTCSKSHKCPSFYLSPFVSSYHVRGLRHLILE